MYIGFLIRFLINKHRLLSKRRDESTTSLSCFSDLS